MSDASPLITLSAIEHIEMAILRCQSAGMTHAHIADILRCLAERHQAEHDREQREAYLADHCAPYRGTAYAS